MVVERKLMRFTVGRYERMGELGVLNEDDRVELLDGEIVEKMEISARHAAVVDRLNHLFVAHLGLEAIVRIQGPIRLLPYSEPEPDVLLIRRRDDYYQTKHPGPAEAFLVVEVSDSSLRSDRILKMPIYARAGIREAWIVDLQHDRVEIHRDPGADGYAVVALFERGDEVAPLAFPDLRIAVDEILGPIADA